MVEFREASVDSAESQKILTDYFALRAEEFPGGGYVPTFPDATLFVPPHGVFLLIGPVGDPFGCGGIRKIADAAHGPRYEVKHLFLRPETRGRGWGRAMLEKLERYAAEWGASELVLDTHHSLEAAAALYTRNGYELIDRYNDNPNATRWYRKRLKPGAVTPE